MNGRVCNKCKEYKDAENFSPNKNSKNGLHSKCKECVNKDTKSSDYLAGRRKYYANNKSLMKDIALKSRYNITLEEYNALLEKQNYKCANSACDITIDTHLSGKSLCVDHDHNTNVVRGLLCMHCNTALGSLKDDLNKIIGLAQYLTNETIC